EFDLCRGHHPIHWCADQHGLACQRDRTRARNVSDGSGAGLALVRCADRQRHRALSIGGLAGLMRRRPQLVAKAVRTAHPGSLPPRFDPPPDYYVPPEGGLLPHRDLMLLFFVAVLGITALVGFSKL